MSTGLSRTVFPIYIIISVVSLSVYLSVCLCEHFFCLWKYSYRSQFLSYLATKHIFGISNACTTLKIIFKLPTTIFGGKNLEIVAPKKSFISVRLFCLCEHFFSVCANNHTSFNFRGSEGPIPGVHLKV